jgi:hypothetical protein
MDGLTTRAKELSQLAVHHAHSIDDRRDEGERGLAT